MYLPKERMVSTATNYEFAQTKDEDDVNRNLSILCRQLTLRWHQSISEDEAALHVDCGFGTEFPTIHHWTRNKTCQNKMR